MIQQWNESNSELGGQCIGGPAIADRAVRAGVKHFIFASSGSVVWGQR